MHLTRPPAWLRTAWDNVEDLELLIKAHGPHITHNTTHCRAGHLLAPDALYRGECRLCANERSRASHARTLIRSRPDIDHVIVERLLTAPESWRDLEATPNERYAAAAVLGSTAWKTLGINGGRARRSAVA